tara:strand:- start:7252 stop:7764 length:513 start_codon:yes stop_codon:yes gene_type:complete
VRSYRNARPKRLTKSVPSKARNRLATKEHKSAALERLSVSPTTASHQRYVMALTTTATAKSTNTNSAHVKSVIFEVVIPAVAAAKHKIKATLVLPPVVQAPNPAVIQPKASVQTASGAAPVREKSHHKPRPVTAKMTTVMAKLMKSQVANAPMVKPNVVGAMKGFANKGP